MQDRDRHHVPPINSCLPNFLSSHHNPLAAAEIVNCSHNPSDLSTPLLTTPPKPGSDLSPGHLSQKRFPQMEEEAEKKHIKE